MKKIFILFSVLFFTQANAQLVSYEKIDSFTVAELQALIDGIGFGNLITPEYDVDIYRVLYRTEFLDSTTLVSGVLAVPKNVVCKVPLVCYQHGTSSKKNNVPSYDGDEINIAIFFASIGNVVVAADYIGLGASTINLHPYMHNFSQAHSGINLMRSARQLNETLDLNLGNQIFLFGYSQGGSASAAVVKYIEEDYSSEFKVTAAAPMSGAYSIAGEQYKMVNSGLPYATPGYLPFIILSYQMMYGNIFNTPSDVFKAPYDSLMPYLLYDHNYNMGYINNQSTPVPADMFKDSVRIYIDAHPEHPFRQALLDNDLLSWTPQTPMRLLYCDGDEQVNYRNSVVADSVWRYNGAPNIQTQNFGTYSHSDCIGLALLNGKNYFASFYNDGVEIEVKYNETQNSYTASIYNDDVNNFNFLWSNGSTSATLQNVNPNTTYSLTATHKTNGCSHTRSFNLNTVVSVKDLLAAELGFKLYPNPANNLITIELNVKNEKAIITNVLGQKVMDVNLENTKNTIDVSKFEKGMYILSIENKNLQKKFIVE